MIGDDANRSKCVTLSEVESYVENMVDAVTQLIVIFGPNTALARIEHLNEIDDLCCLRQCSDRCFAVPLLGGPPILRSLAPNGNRSVVFSSR